MFKRIAASGGRHQSTTNMRYARLQQPKKRPHWDSPSSQLHCKGSAVNRTEGSSGPREPSTPAERTGQRHISQTPLDTPAHMLLPKSYQAVDTIQLTARQDPRSSLLHVGEGEEYVGISRRARLGPDNAQFVTAPPNGNSSLSRTVLCLTLHTSTSSVYYFRQSYLNVYPPAPHFVSAHLPHVPNPAFQHFPTNLNGSHP